MLGYRNLCCLRCQGTGFFERQIGWSGNEAYMHDPLAVAVVSHPDFIETVDCRVAVETRGEHTTGMTLVTPDHQGGIKVAKSVRTREFIDFFMEKMMVQGGI
jgi:inosine-uridine nucleoside N-ribohydrolase